MVGLMLGGFLGAIGAGVGMGFLMKSKAPVAAKVIGGIGLGLLGLLGLAIGAIGATFALADGPTIWVGDSGGTAYAADGAARGAAYARVDEGSSRGNAAAESNGPRPSALGAVGAGALDAVDDPPSYAAAGDLALDWESGLEGGGVDHVDDGVLGDGRPVVASLGEELGATTSRRDEGAGLIGGLVR